jgi:uncharacterized protein (TIGR00725 family)
MTMQKEEEPRHCFYLAVIGAGRASPEVYELAREVGRLAAQKGWIVLTGGLMGVMEAACRGAREAGGLSLGILPGGDRDEANPYADLVVVTHIHHARNSVIAHSADALIAVGGEYGTLSEIALGLKLGKPVIGIGTAIEVPGMKIAKSADDAIRQVEGQIKRPFRVFGRH